MTGKPLLLIAAALLLSATVPAKAQGSVDRDTLVEFHSPSLGDLKAKVAMFERFRVD